MTKLNQIIAVLSGKKTRVSNLLTELYKKVQKETVFQGLSRKYHPLDEEGEQFPSEYKKVEYTVNNAVYDLQQILTDFYDLVLTQDEANTQARGDIKVDGSILIPEVPVTHLMFLEKQLTDLRTFFNHLPVLDPSETWNFSDDAGYYKSNPTRTHKSKKAPKAFVKYHATAEHPAQTEMFTEDVKVGEWEQIKFSGAMEATDKRKLLNNVETLIDAVKKAREEANSIEVEQAKIGDAIFAYLFK